MGWGVVFPMRTKETLKQKAYGLWKKAKLPNFFNRKGPKRTPAWKTYACYLEYTVHAPAWRRASDFMASYHNEERHWTTWQKAVAKWPFWVWQRLGQASVGSQECSMAAIDGTGISRTNASHHYLKRIDSLNKVKRHVQQVVLIDIVKRKFLAWRIRSKPRGETLDVPYLIRHSPITPSGILMDKGFDSNPLHTWLRNQGIWSVAPVKKNCKRGRYRKQLRDCFDYGLYWQRNVVECLIGVVKRLFGSHVRAKTYHMQYAELSSKLIAYNIISAIVNYFLQNR